MNKKLLKLKQVISLSCKIGKSFGISYGINEFLGNAVLRERGKIGKSFHKYRYEKIKRELINKNYPELSASEMEKNNELISDESTIWIFWWQGLDNAPDVVKKCIQSIQQHKGRHSIVVLSKENLREYVEMPDYIFAKVRMGSITITHFSDILRCYLLYTYGGIWMDATLYMTDDFSNDLYTKSFYTIHHNKRTDYHVCRGKWTGFFLASGKGNLLFEYLYKSFINYWEKEDYLICYLLIDCFISIGYDKCVAFKKIIDDVPINNTRVLDLACCYNIQYSEELWDELNRDTYLHKLTYKTKILDIDKSMYSYIISK